tara:strand:+ start:1240 stop:1461 length:222 start_codon:yes stop_codon:yes gene_type:complete
MRHFLIILFVVITAQIVYADKKDYVYKLIGQDWALESGERVLKCLYRYDMKNKLITINYTYPCPKQIINKIKE